MEQQEQTLKQYLEILPECHLAYKEYKVLLEESKVLDALRAAGVDNWEGYGDAMSSLGFK